MIAPNGKQSNLTDSQYKLVRTPAFKEWFGDWEFNPSEASKVVDENGEPLVVYHGTTSIFNEFKVGRTNGLFFTNKKESANRFSSGDLKRVGDSPRILECFLKINKLYNKNTNDEILVNNYYQDFFEKRPYIKKQSQKNILKDKFNKFFMDLVSFGIINDEPKLFLLKYNYNGIVINSDNNAKSYITFNSNQIKLADGSNTTFDSNNNDIRFDGGGLIKKEKQEIILNKNKVFGDGLPTYKLSADGNWVMKLDSRTNKYKSYQNFDFFYDNILEKERLQYARENAKNVFEFLDNNGAELLNKSIDGASRYYLYKNNYIRVSNHWNQSEYKDKETGINKYKFIENNFYSYKKDGWKEMISEIESLNDNDIRYKKGGLIAPNGKQSNLTDSQYKLVRTPAFKEWFGDWEFNPSEASKVVDSNGEPLIVYHGTDAIFNEFKKQKKGWETFWFTPNFDTAKMYSLDNFKKETDKNNSRVLQCFLNVRNPNNKYPFDIIKYDGFIDYKTYMDYDIWKQIKTIQVIQVVSSNQIKLADGSNTTFDSNNNDIRYKKGGLIAPNGKPTLLKNVKVGQKFYMLNKNGTPKFNGNITFEMTSNNGKVFEYFRIENNRVYVGSSLYEQYVVIIDSNEFNKGGQINEYAQQLIDIISMNPQLEKYEKYKVILKNKFGINFDDFYKDDYYIENANLLEIKVKDDFINYDKYIEYSKKIFRLRGLINDYYSQNIEGVISIEKAIEIGKKLKFIVKQREYDGGSGNYAEHSIDTITIPNKVDINSFIHEIGHHYDHFESKEYNGLAKTSTYASSLYEIGKSDEVFAENFKNYFIAPNWLKEKLPMVYNELDKNINDIYKKEIYKLIDSSKEKYEQGGNVNELVEDVSTEYLNSIRNQDKSRWNYDLEKSIEKQGILEPVTIGYWSEYDKVTLVDGHHRLDTAIDLDIKSIPTIIQLYYNNPTGLHKLYQAPKYNPNAKKPSDLGIFKKGGMTNKGYVSYKDKYNRKYAYSKGESHDLKEIAKDTGVSMKGLQQIYNKGIGAYRTNPSSVRPNVKSKEQWAMARVYSSVMGGKASKIDSNELKMEKGGILQDKNSIRKYAENLLKDFDYKFIGFSESNYGQSMYFDVDGIKCRFSNHSVTNRDRMINEILFDINNVNSENTKFGNNQSLLQLRYRLGDTSIKYGKITYLGRSGKYYDAFGYTDSNEIKMEQGGNINIKYNNMSKHKDGLFVGKSHKEGGIPMIVKSTGQKIEVEGGESITNKTSMADDKIRTLTGTNCEIISQINTQNGNGVAMDCDSVVGKKYKYKAGGSIQKMTSAQGKMEKHTQRVLALRKNKAEQESKVENNSEDLIDKRIVGLKIALKFASNEEKKLIQKRIKAFEIAKKILIPNTKTLEDLLEEDMDLQSEIDIEKRKPKNEQSELTRLRLERGVILKKIDEIEKLNTNNVSDIKTMELYVSPMRERNLDKYGEDTNQCISCGKLMKDSDRKYVCMGTDWEAYNTNESEERDGIDYFVGTDTEIQGFFPIGNDCAKKMKGFTFERDNKFNNDEIDNLELLKSKIRNISKKMQYDGESGYGGYVIYLDKDKDKIEINTYTNLSPYSAQASDEVKVLFNAPNKTMIIFSTNVSERFEDNNSFEKYGGIKYIYEPLTNKIASEILEKIKEFTFERENKFNTGGRVYNFSDYSNDALSDMIINLSRYENNEEYIEIVKDELKKRKRKNIGINKKMATGGSISDINKIITQVLQAISENKKIIIGRLIFTSYFNNSSKKMQYRMNDDYRVDKWEEYKNEKEYTKAVMQRVNYYIKKGYPQLIEIN